MTTLLVVEHLKAGEHVELATLNGPIRCLGMPCDDLVLLGTDQLGPGTHVEVTTPNGPLPLFAHPSPVGGESRLMASTNVAPGQAVHLNTPQGTLIVRGYDPEAGEIEALGAAPAPEQGGESGGELPPPTRP